MVCKICYFLDSLKNLLLFIFLLIEYLRIFLIIEVLSIIKLLEVYCKENRKKKKIFLLCLIIYECILIFFII